MSDVVKAKIASIFLGKEQILVLQMPDGSYCLSKTNVAKSAGKTRQSIANFLKGSSSEALPYKSFTPLKVKVEGKRALEDAIPIPLATAYWRYLDKRNVVEASALVDACISESIERRADKAFAVSRTEEERNERFAVRVEDYVLKNAIPWNIKLDGAKPFTFEFYEHLYRIRGGIWQKRNPNSSQRPACVGAWTNKFVYDLFPGEVPEKLKQQYKNQTGSRRKYEFLTQEIGRTHLVAHMSALLAIMRNAMSNNWDRFLKMVEVGIPSNSVLAIQMELDFLIEMEEEWAKRIEG